MEKEPNIKVTDRRSFTPEGDPREDVPLSGSGEQAEAQATEPHGESYSRGHGVDFNHLTVSFYQQALHALGLLQGAAEEADSTSPKVDLPAAQYFIDLLGLMQEKTKNNLTPAEEKLLADILYELRMAFVHVSKGSGGQAK